METWSIHSAKGGVGKSMISVNLAFLLAKKGYNVCIIDYDLAAPNLHTYLGRTPRHFLNDYHNNSVELGDCIEDLSDTVHLGGGKLYACFSNPSSSSIDEMMKLDEKKATKMLRKLISIKKIMQKEYQIDYLLVDTSPGIGLTVVNSFIVSERIIFIVRFSKVDIESTINMLNGFKESINETSSLVVNMVPPKLFDEGRHLNLEQVVKSVLQSGFDRQSIQFGGWIPTDRKFVEQEFELATQMISGYSVEIPILVNESMEIPFSIALNSLCEKLTESS